MLQALQPFAKLPAIAILPIDTSQILVLRDYSENVKRMLEMIKKVDVAVPSEYISEVIPIKYALAAEIASALNSLSSGGGGTTVGGGTAGTGTTGSSMAGSRMGIGGMRQLRARRVRQQLRQRLRRLRPIGLSAAEATADPTPRLSRPALAGGCLAPAAASPTGSSASSSAPRTGEIQILGQTKIIADERTNSLLIFASREDMKMIKDIVAKLDVVLAQVLIEAVIIEVSLNKPATWASATCRSPQSTAIGSAASAPINNRNVLSPGQFTGAITSGAGHEPTGCSPGLQLPRLTGRRPGVVGHRAGQRQPRQHSPAPPHSDLPRRAGHAVRRRIAALPERQLLRRRRLRRLRLDPATCRSV